LASIVIFSANGSGKADGNNVDRIYGGRWWSTYTVSRTSATLLLSRMIKNEIAVCTAMAGENAGYEADLYGCGKRGTATHNRNMILQFLRILNIPLCCCGGITSPEKAYLNCQAGADVNCCW
jgi:hypothetical protein